MRYCSTRMFLSFRIVHGCSGNIMSGSKVYNLWATMSKESAITGHAYSRVLRAHFIIEHALAIVLLMNTDVIDDGINSQEIVSMKTSSHQTPQLASGMLSENM